MKSSNSGKTNKIDLIVEKLDNCGYKRPQTIQDLIDNRDIMFKIISDILDDEMEKTDAL